MKIDLSGKKFGRLTVLCRAPARGNNKNSRWLCRCECGSETDPITGNLTRGLTKSCGCLKRERDIENGNFRRAKLVGQKFGRLTVLEFSAVIDRKAAWLCACECGNHHIVNTYLLRSGRVKSCGCLQKEGRIALHGGYGTVEYNAFQAAKGRCNNPNNAYYYRYGGRGIEFRFSSFEEWLQELGLRPSDKHSVDRINNNSHYAPGNVRWALPKEQWDNKQHCITCTCTVKN